MKRIQLVRRACARTPPWQDFTQINNQKNPPTPQILAPGEGALLRRDKENPRLNPFPGKRPVRSNERHHLGVVLASWRRLASSGVILASSGQIWFRRGGPEVPLVARGPKVSFSNQTYTQECFLFGALDFLRFLGPSNPATPTLYYEEILGFVDFFKILRVKYSIGGTPRSLDFVKSYNCKISSCFYE